jgi:hypothetical protein
MNEWEFTAEVASWINETLASNPNLPFSRAKCEQVGEGSRKRRDLTLLDKDQRIVLTGEVKLPYRQDGGSPYNALVVRDARTKARRAKASFFFTWNVNEFVLWETEVSKISWQEEKYRSWEVTSIHREGHLELTMTTHSIRAWLPAFLSEFAQIIRGTAIIGVKSPDEKFIEALESFLHMPILLCTEELDTLYKKPSFKVELDQWMREEQGWVIYDDPEGIRDNLERASKFACYALVNKLVFHEALLKRYSPSMSKLSVPDYIDTGEKLRLHLEGYFSEAKAVTRDYETVFGEEHASLGNRIPFYSNSAVVHWRALIEQIHQFDFSKLDYEIIGNIFERLISPEERRKFGQFYTKVEVVDLINSFCVQTGKEKVMDPACGGGTFLVRAYARKRELNPARKHGELLSELFGVDVSNFATHLTTINLATRDLIDTENYPQIARSDFFNIHANKTFLILPSRVEMKGLGREQHRNVVIPPLDAVVGNPPYIRQEDIPRAKKKGNNGPEPGTKEYYQQLVLKESGAKLSGRSDIHCYFWPHATSFLSDEGYLCFLTSSQWLDVEYGFRLQEWILNNFQIVAIFESVDEPWFIGARVVTAVTILKRQHDEEKRMSNTVRFVQLRRPLGEILANDGTTAGAVYATNRFRDEILALNSSSKTERYRARLIRQGDLWAQGMQLGNIMRKSEDNELDDEVRGSTYYGGKWGVYLRAPDLWFELQDRTGRSWAGLGTISEVKRGITSGCDDFFYVRDTTKEYLNKYTDEFKFKVETGFSRKDFTSGKMKIVACGKSHSELKAVEAKYLESEIHSLMEIDGYSVTSEDCSRQVLMVSVDKKHLRNTHVLGYILWGESKNWHKGTTCAARASSEKQWYDLTGHRRAPALWPKERQYRHIAPSNPDRLAANCRLYEIYPSKEYDDPDLWGGILNSTWVLFSSLQFGRPVGNEGNWSTMVVDVNMMLVPDPRKAKPSQLAKVIDSFRLLKQRKALMFLSERRLREMSFTKSGKKSELDNLSNESELDMLDRRELDDAVLELLGLESPQRRQELIDELYSYLREYFEFTRQKEEKAIINKNKAKRRGPARPGEIATQIFKDITENNPHLLRQYDSDFLDRSKPFDTFEIPAEGTAEVFSDMFTEHGVRFMKGAKRRVALVETTNQVQDELLVLVANSGVRGLVRLPHEDGECQRVLQEYEKFINQREDQVRQLINERTADESIQEEIYEALAPMLLNVRRW